LLDTAFEAMPPMRLYRTSDLLVRHHDAIEEALFSRIQDLFGLSVTVTLCIANVVIRRELRVFCNRGKIRGTLSPPAPEASDQMDIRTSIFVSGTNQAGRSRALT
jgi:hypothetical protein